MTGDVTVAAGATLTVHPGVRAEATGDYTLTIAGALQVSASAANPAVFTTTSLAHGAWRGVHFVPGSVAAVSGGWFTRAIDKVTVDAAHTSFTACSFLGAGRDGAAVYNQAQFTARNCTFANNGRRGLYLETVYPQGSITGCSFTNNGEYPLFLKANCVGMLGAGLTFRGNANPQIAVSASAAVDVQQSQTWHSQPVPLDLTVGSTDALTIPAGVALTLQPPLTLIGSRVQVAGKLVSGQAGKAWVNLMGPSPTPGSWEGVYLEPGAVADFHSTRVHHAATALTADSAHLTVHDSDFYLNQFDGLSVSGASWLILSDSLTRRNGRYGLRLAGTAAPVIQGCLLSNNEGDGVTASDAAEPNLGNLNNADSTDDGGNAFSSNGGYDVRNRSTARITAQNNWWGTGDAAAIRARIYDGNDSAGYGVVAFSPFLDPAGRTAPALTWTGQPGYVNGGVVPTSGAPQQQYDFRVKYASPAGREPRYVRLYLSAGGYSYPAWHTGPQVGTGLSAVLTSVAASPAAGGKVAVRCQLTQPAELSIRAVNLAGRPVATVAAGLACEAGERLVLWSRRSDRGTLLPAGVYLVEVMARTHSGQQARQVVTVSLR